MLIKHLILLPWNYSFEVRFSYIIYFYKISPMFSSSSHTRPAALQEVRETKVDDLPAPPLRWHQGVNSWSLGVGDAPWGCQPSWPCGSDDAYGVSKINRCYGSYGEKMGISNRMTTCRGVSVYSACDSPSMDLLTRESHGTEWNTHSSTLCQVINTCQVNNKQINKAIQWHSCLQ